MFEFARSWFSGASGPGDGPGGAGALRKWLPVIDADYCIGCGLCVAACDHGSLELVWSFATLSGVGKCESEGTCVGACPEGIIRMAWVPADGDPGVGRWQGR